MNYLDNSHVVANIICHLDICELIIHANTSLSPYYKHLRDREVIAVINQHYRLPQSTTLPNVVTNYFNRYFYTVHDTYPRQFNQMLELVIKYQYVDTVNQILQCDKIMNNMPLASQVYKLLIKYQPLKFITIENIPDNLYVPLSDYMFKIGASDPVIYHMYLRCSITVQMLMVVYDRTVSGIESLPDQRNIQSIIWSYDVKLWKYNNITAGHITECPPMLDAEICNYLDDIGWNYAGDQLPLCEDVYSFQWLIGKLGQLTYAIFPGMHPDTNIIDMCMGTDHKYYCESNTHPELLMYIYHRCTGVKHQLNLTQ